LTVDFFPLTRPIFFDIIVLDMESKWYMNLEFVGFLKIMNLLLLGDEEKI